MSDQPENIVLAVLRRIEAKLDRVLEDVRELNGPITAIEQHQANISFSMDGLEKRMTRIERRFGLDDLVR